MSLLVCLFTNTPSPLPLDLAVSIRVWVQDGVRDWEGVISSYLNLVQMKHFQRTKDVNCACEM